MESINRMDGDSCKNLGTVFIAVSDVTNISKNSTQLYGVSIRPYELIKGEIFIDVSNIKYRTVLDSLPFE